MPALRGFVKNWMDRRGFGFISPSEGGKPLFVHYSELKSNGYRSLKKGEPVEYDLGEDNGKPKAVNVCGPGGVFVQGFSRRIDKENAAKAAAAAAESPAADAAPAAAETPAAAPILDSADVVMEEAAPADKEAEPAEKEAVGFFGMDPLSPALVPLQEKLAAKYPSYTNLKEHMASIEADQWKGLMAEWKDLSELDDTLERDEAQWTSAWLPANESRNRYYDILANEATRIKLSTDGSDYINANLLDGAAFGLEGHRYICGQAPVQSTIGHFWQMIWQEDVNMIMMVARLAERGIVKCDLYWPGAVGESVTHGPFTVTLKEEGTLNGCDEITKRTLEIAGPEGAKKTVQHYQYLGWPDHGVPQDAVGILELLREMEGHKGTVMVHCSAGVGRTGVLMVTHLTLMQHAKAVEAGVPVPYNIVQTVCRLRCRRAHLVQTPEQLAFCYNVVRTKLEPKP